MRRLGKRTRRHAVQDSHGARAGATAVGGSGITPVSTTGVYKARASEPGMSARANGTRVVDAAAARQRGGAQARLARWQSAKKRQHTPAAAAGAAPARMAARARLGGGRGPGTSSGTSLQARRRTMWAAEGCAPAAEQRVGK